MSQQMHPKLVNSWKTFNAKLTVVSSFAMVSSNMFANNRILYKLSVAVWTIKSVFIVAMSFNVISQEQNLVELFLTHWTFKSLLFFWKPININYFFKWFCFNKNLLRNILLCVLRWHDKAELFMNLFRQISHGSGFCSSAPCTKQCCWSRVLVANRL